MSIIRNGVALRYPGAKGKASRLLHALAPTGYSEYREPFFGSGTMLSGAMRSACVWINDKSPMVVRFLEWFRDDEDALEKMVTTARRLTCAPDAQIRREFVQARAAVMLYRDPYSYWLLNRLAASAIVSLKRRDIASLSQTLRRNGMTPIRRERLLHFRDSLRAAHVTLTQGDYRALLRASGEQVWVYLDPPYLLRRNSQIYEFGFTRADQLQLAHELKQCPHAWMLSNGDSRFVRRLYSGFRIRHRRYTGSIQHRTLERGKSELIITNY